MSSSIDLSVFYSLTHITAFFFLYIIAWYIFIIYGTKFVYIENANVYRFYVMKKLSYKTI